MSTSRHGPFAVELRDSDGTNGWRSVVFDKNDRWTRDDAGNLTIRRAGSRDTSVSVYPPSAWFGLRFVEPAPITKITPEPEEPSAT